MAKVQSTNDKGTTPTVDTRCLSLSAKIDRCRGIQVELSKLCESRRTRNDWTLSHAMDRVLISKHS